MVFLKLILSLTKEFLEKGDDSVDNVFLVFGGKFELNSRQKVSSELGLSELWKQKESMLDKCN